MPEKAKRKRMAKGSFTVEAALLMTVLLPVIVSLIYTAFFLHDRTLLQGAACEVAAMGSNLSEEKDIDQILEKIKNQVMSARLLGTKDKAATVNRSKDRIEVSYQGTFSIPGLIAKLSGRDSLKINRSWQRELYNPADIIRKIRGLKYMMDTIKG